MDVPEAQRQYQRALEAFRLCPDEECVEELDEARDRLEVAWLEQIGETGPQNVWQALRQIQTLAGSPDESDLPMTREQLLGLLGGIYTMAGYWSTKAK